LHKGEKQKFLVRRWYKPVKKSLLLSPQKAPDWMGMGTWGNKIKKENLNQALG